MAGFFSKIADALSKTREAIVSHVGGLVSSGRPVDKALLAELEDALVAADCGPVVSREIVEALEKESRRRSLETGDELRKLLVELVVARVSDPAPAIDPPPLEVIFAVGVNGVGKTTTLAKLARRFASAGRKPILAAADTFRAAAAEQLEVWAERVGVPVVRQKSGADPAAVLFDAIAAAKSRGHDLVLTDTAGRLHNKKPLMDELAKLRRIAGREVPGAPHHVFLVLDATTGSNGVAQAREFQAAAGATAVILTKLDGTAKGGVVIQIRRELGLPVRWVGVGEGIDDLEPFDPRRFAEAFL